jgi:hypothetical protein
VSIRRGANGGPVVAETTPASMARTMTLFLQMREITLDELIESRIELETMLAGMAAEAVGRDEAARRWTSACTSDRAWATPM